MSTIKEIILQSEELIGQKVSLHGWIRTIRNSKNFGFIELNDGSAQRNLQVVFSADKLGNYEEVAKFNLGSSIEVAGELVTSLGGKQAIELQAEKVALIGDCPDNYPLQKKEHSYEFLREIAHLRMRTNTFSAVFRVRSLLAYAIHKFFIDQGFVYTHTPIITGSDCEGAGEMFRVTTLDLNNVLKTAEGKIDVAKDFFGKETNLTVSGQLEAETFAMAFGKVYTFGPTFRAENSNTKRHAAEFWMIEPEVAFNTLKENMDLAEEMLKYVIKYALDNAPEEMVFFNKNIDIGLLERLNLVVNSGFERITYTEAVEKLRASGAKFEFPVEWGKELQTEHEKYLTENIYKKPVIVTNYPKGFKAFYMRLDDGEKTVSAMDVLVPGIGEIIGGSQREERLDVLLSRIKEMGLKESDYSWYLDLRRFGGVPHSGFGLGFERMVMYVTGMDNIRDVIPFPRTPGNAEF